MNRVPGYALVVILGVGWAARADHASLPPGVSPIAATWLWGHHAIPGTITRDGAPYLYAYPHTDASRIVDPRWSEAALRHVEAGAKAPAAVVLHGCSGLIRGSVGYRVLLLSEGFAVFEPDAFARPGHACRGSTPRQRGEEADYALDRVRELPWVDQERVLLMGFSQGGRAVALRNTPGYAAHVILMAPARPVGPGDAPVLSVAGAEDEYADPDSYDAVAASGAEGSKAILIAGQGHDILAHPELQAALRAFVRKHFR